MSKQSNQEEAASNLLGCILPVIFFIILIKCIYYTTQLEDSNYLARVKTCQEEQFKNTDNCKEFIEDYTFNTRMQENKNKERK